MKMSSQSILRISYILLAGILLVSSDGCHVDPPPPPPVDDDITRVGKKQLAEGNQVWIAANSPATNNSFYIKGDTAKVISFKIERNEVDTLLAIQNSISGKDSSLRLRIFLTLDSTVNLPPATPQPVFRPILNLSTLSEKDTTFQSEASFKMDFLRMDIITYLDSLIKVLTPIVSPEKPINPKTALRLITAWDTLDQNRINTEMYEEGTRPTPQGRVRYYTFNRSDTYGALQKLRTNKEDLLYLHLGINNHPTDTIPFCTILHIDDPANFKDPTRIDLEDPPLFEFSAPCPRYCGNEDETN